MNFLWKHKEKFIVTFIAVLLLIIIGLTSGNRNSISKGENIVGKALTPVAKLSSWVKGGVDSAIGSVRDIFAAKNENKSLKLRVAELEEEIIKLENIIGKSDFLEAESKLLKDSDKSLIKANIIGKEPGNRYDLFTIDKGLRAGIKVGDTIVAAVESDTDIFIEGLVGRVTEVGDTWSKVVSIVNERNSISFKVIRTQDGGIAYGSNDNELEGYMFDMEADVIQGDKLYTSGLGGVYLKDIYIGEIQSIDTSRGDLMKYILVKPTVNFRKLNSVFIIKALGDSK